MVKTYVYVPEFITVHLGRPNAAAENVTVSFPSYIKNVASSEIYPTWPNASLRANIYAQITFALNRIYTEWYRSRGYPFDITNSTQYDQAFVKGRSVFSSVGAIVDEIFNRYVVRQGQQNPYFTEFCNGTTVTCAGLSQWGTVELAKQGYTPYNILQYYYGDDIDIKTAPVMPYSESYPGYPLRLGSTGRSVELVQRQLNRVAQNYPAIPMTYPVDGIFGANTEASVKKFQEVFGLTADGVVGPATWYKLSYIYSSVKRLAELYGEGVALSEVPKQYPDAITLGRTGREINVLQYFINVLAAFYEEIGPVPQTGVYDEETRQQVINFQRLAGLEPDGIVGEKTWDEIVDANTGIFDSVPLHYFTGEEQRMTGRFPGYDLKEATADAGTGNI